MSNQIEQIDPVPAYISGDVTVPEDGTIYDPDIVAPFFAAIRAGDVDLVTSLLDATPSLAHTPEIYTPFSRPLYNATLTTRLGILPLYAATVAGNPYIVALLAQRGAPIDELSPTGNYYDDKIPIMRTALMAAASQGSIPLVKLLFNDLKADDTVVAPDGVIALRLAVLGNHTEIVALLPTRRRGGWLRFKHSQRKAMRRIRKAGYALYRFGRFFVWDLPKFFVWDIPKACLPSIKQAIRAIPRIPSAMYRLTKRLSKGLWKVISRLPQFITTLAKEVWKVVSRLPQFIATLAKKLWAMIKEIPSLCVEFIKGCWTVAKAIARWSWKLITQTIPQLLRSAIIFVGRKLAATGRFLLQLLMDVASFFHTLLTAIITCFKAVTLKDIIHALSVVLVSVPKWIWETIRDVAVAIKNGTIWTLQQMGDLVHCLVRLVWELLLWIPKKVGQITVGMGEIGVAGVREVAWWINPKLRVSCSGAP
jgi:hypothetical protein